MAVQRITIAKIGGDASDVVVAKLGWARHVTTDNQLNGWAVSGPQTSDQIDQFAEQIRSHSTSPPVIHFVEWVDIVVFGDSSIG